MTVREAKATAQEWVIHVASKIKGFQGALFHGSINWSTEESLLSVTSDVDIIVVLDNPSSHFKPGKFIYQHILLDVSCLLADQLLTSEVILSNYRLAGSFSTSSIIADPTGHITKLQKAIAKNYAKRYWVYKRCQDAMHNALHFLRQSKASDPLHDQVSCWLFAKGVMTHILLVAGLKNPTVRQRYVAAQKLLADYHCLDFHEELLASLGCDQMNPIQVEHYLVNLTKLFDVAKTVIKTPYRFASDISDMTRPIVVDGSYELIKQGYHREALFWIVATFSRCQHVLSCDATKELQEEYNHDYRQLLSDLHVPSYQQLLISNEQTEKFLPRVWEVATSIVAQNAEIVS